MLSKNESKMLQGMAILAMLALHLFCRNDNLPYQPVIMVAGVPVVYYLGLFGDICVPIYCFTSGYAQFFLAERDGDRYRRNRLVRIWKFIRHFWLVLCLSCITGVLLNDADMPGTLSKLLGNLFLYNLSYNGAWWFVLTYVFLLLGAPLVVWLTNKIHPLTLVVISGVLYVIAYSFYFVYQITFENLIITWVWHQALLLFRSLFSFVLGAVFCHDRLFGRLREMNIRKWLKAIILIVVPLSLLVGHAVIQSLIIAPITALGCVCCFIIWDKPKWIQRIFEFLGNHSFNIWLVHMFFYLYLFENLVFKLKYPFFIYIGMLGICICVSYVINWLESLLNMLQKKIYRGAV